MRGAAPQVAYRARTCGRRGREIVLARDLPIPPSTTSGLDATCASGSNCPSGLAQLERTDGSRGDESRRTISRIPASALRTQVPARYAPCGAAPSRRPVAPSTHGPREMCCGSEPCERRVARARWENISKGGLPARSRTWLGRIPSSRRSVFPRRRAVRRAARFPRPVCRVSRRLERPRRAEYPLATDLPTPNPISVPTPKSQAGLQGKTRPTDGTAEILLPVSS